MRVNVLRIVDVVVRAHGIRCVTSSVLSRGLKTFFLAATQSARLLWHSVWCDAHLLHHSMVSFFSSFLFVRVVSFVIRGEAVLCVRASNNIFSNTMDLLLLFPFGGANVCVCDVCASLNVVCNSLRFMEIVLGIIFCWWKKKRKEKCETK